MPFPPIISESKETTSFFLFANKSSHDMIIVSCECHCAYVFSLVRYIKKGIDRSREARGDEVHDTGTPREILEQKTNAGASIENAVHPISQRHRPVAWR